MGAWGAGLYQNDRACDVRDALTEAIGNGAETDEAIRGILQEFAEEIEDESEADEVWIALAATLSKLGRLTDPVRDRALSAIDSGRSLELWEEFAKPRAKTLKTLREKLVGPQPAPRRIRKPKTYVTPFTAGDLLRIPISEGRAVLAIVAAREENGQDQSNIVRLLRLDDGRPFDATEFGPDLCQNDRFGDDRNFIVYDVRTPADIVRIGSGIPLPDPLPQESREFFDDMVARGRMAYPVAGYAIGGALANWTSLRLHAEAFVSRA